ncbi:MAG: hypothetical protein L6W00_15485 [Lentisphaeria bacterium]|nr:MAG: hypothetical protein L6W00_15485 [Lentisphaeria bacterium]
MGFSLLGKFLTEFLTAHPEWRVLVIGGLKDAGHAREILAAVPPKLAERISSGCGRLSLRESVAAIHGSALFCRYRQCAAPLGAADGAAGAQFLGRDGTGPAAASVSVARRDGDSGGGTLFSMCAFCGAEPLFRPGGLYGGDIAGTGVHGSGAAAPAAGALLVPCCIVHEVIAGG